MSLVYPSLVAEIDFCSFRPVQTTESNANLQRGLLKLILKQYSFINRNSSIAKEPESYVRGMVSPGLVAVISFCSSRPVQTTELNADLQRGLFKLIFRQYSFINRNSSIVKEVCKRYGKSRTGSCKRLLFFLACIDNIAFIVCWGKSQ